MKTIRTRSALLAGAALVLASAAVAVAPAPAWAAAGTTRVSSSSSGAPGDGPSEAPWATADARFVGFSSSATNLVPGDTNFAEDVFLRDRTTSRTERISVASDGSQGQYPSMRPAISADGRYIAFDTLSTLVPDDTNGQTDVFLRDRQAGTTTRLSMGTGGAQANGSSYGASISPDGRYVAFTSYASNLVTGDTNAVADVFLLDRQTGGVTRVSVNASGQAANGSSDSGTVSADGRYVAFESQASNLVSGDSNSSMDVFVKDFSTGAVQRVSVTSGGAQFGGGGSAPSMSADGRYVSFSGQPTNALAQLYVRDRTAGTTTLVSVGTDGKPGNYATFQGTISANGRYVGFGTGATNIVPGSPNYFNSFVRDLVTGHTTLASLTYTGAPIMESTLYQTMTNAGLVFVAFAAGVVPDAVGRQEQVYFRSF